MKLERIYTVPLGEAYEAVRYKRVPRAVKLLRAFIGKHMKADGERIVLSTALNASLWTRSIKKPPRRVKVRLIKDDGMIRAYLADEKPEKPTEKQAAEKPTEKPEAKAKAGAGQNAEQQPKTQQPKIEQKPKQEPGQGQKPVLKPDHKADQKLEHKAEHRPGHLEEKI